MRWTLLSCLVTISILASASQGEFQVNTHTTWDQKDAAIATDAAGSFVVVWNSYRQDGDSGGIFGQRFDPNCRSLGSEFQVNTTTPGNQTEPSVAIDAVGSFVVAWHGPGISEEDIFAQRFDPNGQPFGVEFQVNSRTESRQRYPKVTMNTAGAFTVVWEGEKVEAESSTWVICCRLYDVNGTDVGGEFEVNLEADSRYPDVAVDGSGNFAVVWMQENSNNSIIARLYDADGTARMEPFEVSTIRFSSITRPSIAMSDNGHFVVAWDGDPNLASLDDVHARLYEPNGTAMAEQFTINADRPGVQQYPAVAMNDSREFVIVWNSRVDPNVNERDIFGRRYDSLGRAVSGEFQVNTYAEADQRYPAVAMKESGEFVAVWESHDQDGSRYGIFGQMMASIGSADFSGDGFVDFNDYCILAEEWQKEENPLRADLIDDDKVDEQDIAEFCYQWLTSGNE